MQYRTLAHGGEDVSVIGMGAGSLHNSEAAEIERIVDAAVDAGVNHFDFIPSKTCVLAPMGKALARHRSKVHVQVHIGACYSSGSYGWTTNAKQAINEFEQRLDVLQSNYADFGFIHCIDELSDLDKVMNGGIWDYAQKRKADGTIVHLGFSTHSTTVARKLLKTDAFDLAMFSINPMYDYTDESAYGKGEAADRAALYTEFEAAGVGVSVMKAFAGGQLLDAAQSPFGVALSQAQCIQYALDRPGVLSVLPGIRNMGDLNTALSFIDASEAERDYSVLGSVCTQNNAPSCVYCNHCQPCPAGLEIGLINKYYDLAKLGDEMARDHYMNLNASASNCTGCKHCDKRCPFGVAQCSRMARIAAYFGK